MDIERLEEYKHVIQYLHEVYVPDIWAVKHRAICEGGVKLHNIIGPTLLLSSTTSSLLLNKAEINNVLHQ